ncbi:MAG: polymorphic toxin type 50 domain-containing protein [Turicibacter sp.]|nr:polymorphic toxin type 50 domain-containing protein [Turicibacter sp.]
MTIDTEIRKLIKSAETNKIINPEKQGRHILGHPLYVAGRSYLLDGVDPQELVDKYHGTGECRTTKKGEWDKKEHIAVGKIVGVHLNLAGMQTLTSNITIHYSKTGTHIVPAKGE